VDSQNGMSRRRTLESLARYSVRHSLRRLVQRAMSCVRADSIRRSFFDLLRVLANWHSLYQAVSILPSFFALFLLVVVLPSSLTLPFGSFGGRFACVRTSVTCRGRRNRASGVNPL